MSSELDKWVGRVDAFGGRIADSNLTKELATSNLGSTKELDVMAPVLNLQPTIVLAEMRLSSPIAVDVTFSFGSLVIEPIGPAPGGAMGNQVGAGYVRVTWGTNGGVQFAAEIDGANGWRHEFTASYLRVEYIPIDALAGTIWQLPAGQAKNFSVSASITPASGQPCSKLTRTRYFDDLQEASLAVRSVPQWAEDWEVQFHNPTGGPVILWQMTFLMANFTSIGGYYANGVAGEWPSYGRDLGRRTVPQNGIALFLQNLAAGQFMRAPQVIFGLAL